MKLLVNGTSSYEKYVFSASNIFEKYVIIGTRPKGKNHWRIYE
jgi:hypothetical protein